MGDYRNFALPRIDEKTPTEYEVTESKPGLIATIREKTTAKRASQHLYITGLRGIMVVESFLWTYFITFIPALASSQTPAPEYQNILREILCVPFWNSSLIYNFFIILSMRTICVSFLENPTGQTYAATVIRRIIRMVVILVCGSGMATLILSQIGTEHIQEFKARLPNQSIETPVKVHNALAAFNSHFNLFWITRDFFQQAANSFWPTMTLWAPSVMYFQSFTVYFLMVILPYTRPKWHLRGIGLFAIGSFWMGQWGWYSATGVILADIAINPTLQSELKAGVKLRGEWRFPYWAIATTFAAIGVALKYTFAVRPQYVNSLIVLYPYYDLSESYSPSTLAAAGPYPRLDDWLIIMGIMLAVELFESAQYLLSFKPLVWLGERSFSIFVAQCIFFWTGGIKLWLVLSEKGISTAGANAVVFVVGLLAVAAFSELFYVCIDLPSRWLATNTYIWLVN